MTTHLDYVVNSNYGDTSTLDKASLKLTSVSSVCDTYQVCYFDYTIDDLGSWLFRVTTAVPSRRSSRATLPTRTASFEQSEDFSM